MINRKEDPVEWAMLGSGLAEARQHLDSLIKKMDSKPDFDEVDFGIELGHIYAHLNLAWNGRDKKGEWSDADYEKFREYPAELQPDGTWPPLSETRELLRVVRWHTGIRSLVRAVMRVPPFRFFASLRRRKTKAPGNSQPEP